MQDSLAKSSAASCGKIQCSSGPCGDVESKEASAAIVLPAPQNLSSRLHIQANPTMLHLNVQNGSTCTNENYQTMCLGLPANKESHCIQATDLHFAEAIPESSRLESKPPAGALPSTTEQQVSPSI